MDSAWLPSAAELAYSAFREFYDLFSVSQSAIHENISRQFLEEASEIASTRLLISKGECIGMYSIYPTSERAARQGATLRMLFELAEEDPSEVFTRLSAFREQVSGPSTQGQYLARIAVAPGLKGKGLGQELIKAFENETRARGDGFATLHVRRDNAPAMRFYTAAGYVPEADDARAYLALVKPL